MKGGIVAMPNTRYKPRLRKGRTNSMDLTMYTREMSTDNSEECNVLRKNLARALQQDVTPRQRDMLYLYYNKNLTMEEIGNQLGVDKSTVSRTLKRGEARLQRCLRYGAAAILRNLDED